MDSTPPDVMAEIPEKKPYDSPPTYRIDLSLPPYERYAKVAADFGLQMRDLTSLFDEVIQCVVPWAPMRPIHAISRAMLRRVYTQEENEELRGIADVAGIDMYLLVAFNVLLDSFMGCTSGGVRVRPRDGSKKLASTRMMHFRTLDWGMDRLRDMIVILEFVRSSGGAGNIVLGRSVTYAGFVGVLTGVRRGLSLSLNFRPTHSCSTIRLFTHQLLVLLGFRPSIASLLRASLFSEHSEAVLRKQGPPLDLASAVGSFPSKKSTVCYVIFNDGHGAVVIEKDHTTAQIRTSSDFIAATNHDTIAADATSSTNTHVGMSALLEESTERLDYITKRWTTYQKRNAARQKLAANAGTGTGTGTSTSLEKAVPESIIVKWMGAYPITNECTHFACLLDPETGTIRWLKRSRLEMVCIDD